MILPRQASKAVAKYLVSRAGAYNRQSNLQSEKIGHHGRPDGSACANDATRSHRRHDAIGFQSRRPVCLDLSSGYAFT